MREKPKSPKPVTAEVTRRQALATLKVCSKTLSVYEGLLDWETGQQAYSLAQFAILQQVRQWMRLYRRAAKVKQLIEENGL